MNTDNPPDLRRGVDSKLVLKEETQRIIGHSFDVLNEVGHGLHEKIYENAMTVAFKLDGIAFDQQRRFPVLFRGAEVGEFIPDLIAFGSIIVDAKVIDLITDHERGKMIKLPAYHKASGWPDLEFQTRPSRMGTCRRVIRPSVFIRVHPWLN